MPYPNDQPTFGEIYFLDFNPARGSEQAGHRPGVVISRDEYSRNTRVVTVAAITSSPNALAQRRHSPVCVHLPEGQPTPNESLILAFQIVSVDKTRLERYVGKISVSQQAALKAAMRLSFNL